MSISALPVHCVLDHFLHTNVEAEVNLDSPFSHIISPENPIYSRIIKMSSPTINNVIGVGAACAQLSIPLFGLDVDHLASLCIARTCLLCVSFTLLFGGLFSKTWRVHRVFRIGGNVRTVIRDYHVGIIISVLLVIDLCILVPWNLLHPLHMQRINLPDVVDAEEDTIYSHSVYICTSDHLWVYLGLLFAYKGLLLFYGAILAWETRKIRISDLNDSRMIATAVYNVSLLSVIGVSVNHFLLDQPEARFLLTSICVLTSALSTTCCIFIPKVVNIIAHRKIPDDITEINVMEQEKNINPEGTLTSRLLDVSIIPNNYKELEEKYRKVLVSVERMRLELRDHVHRGCLTDARLQQLTHRPP